MPRHPDPPDAPCATCGLQKDYAEYYRNPKKVNGRESRCKECCRKRSAEYGKAHPKTAAEYAARSAEARRKYPDKVRLYAAAWQRAQRRKVRIAVFDAYGRVCKCCGETEEAFLCIDHVYGGGNEHRRGLRGIQFATWLYRQGFPEGFQTLCFNCNYAKSHNPGGCPHEIARQLASVEAG